MDLSDRGLGAVDVWLLDLVRNGLASRFTFDAANDGSAIWSPDGSRVVFTSNRKGNFDLYQKASSGAATNGGIQPRWRQDGREIFYVTLPPDTTVMAAAVTAADTVFEVSAAGPLFTVRLPGSVNSSFYQVSPDGKRFLVNMAPAAEAVATPITVVVNWTAGLQK